MNFAWFPYSLTSFLLLGIGYGLFKAPAAKQFSKLATGLLGFAIQLVLALLFFRHYFSTSWNVVLIGALWGTFYAALTTLQLKALDYGETNQLFPITSTTSLAISVIVGFFLFQESVSFIQICGMALVILTIYLFGYKKGKIQFPIQFLWLGLGVVFFSAGNKLLLKFVADEFNIYSFVIYQHLFASIAGSILLSIFRPSHWKEIFSPTVLKYGLPVGVMLFFGGVALLTALERGPFTLVISLHSLYSLVSALTAWFLFKEKLTVRKLILIGLAIVAVLLIRLG